jgi:hypothetical protein
MSRNYKKFKKELFEKNIGLKKEFELLGTEREQQFAETIKNIDNVVIICFL